MVGALARTVAWAGPGGLGQLSSFFFVSANVDAIDEACAGAVQPETTLLGGIPSADMCVPYTCIRVVSIYI